MNDLVLKAQQAYDKDGMPGAAKVLLEAALGEPSCVETMRP